MDNFLNQKTLMTLIRLAQHKDVEDDCMGRRINRSVWISLISQLLHTVPDSQPHQPVKWRFRRKLNDDESTKRSRVASVCAE